MKIENLLEKTEFSSEMPIKKDIIKSNKFSPSYLNPQMDTAFGEGWYSSQ